MNRTAVQRLLTVSAMVGAFSLAAATTALGQDARTFTSCFGAAQEFVNGGTQNAAVASGAALAVLPFSTFSAGASGAAGDTDLYVVTLSGQADNTAGGFTVQAQASINGGAFFNMNPVGPNIFLQSTVAETNTMTWCNRIGATQSLVIRINWGKFGGGVAILDNYTALVHRSN
jgi:hypothetical protein